MYFKAEIRKGHPASYLYRNTVRISSPWVVMIRWRLREFPKWEFTGEISGGMFEHGEKRLSFTVVRGRDVGECPGGIFTEFTETITGSTVVLTSCNGDFNFNFSDVHVRYMSSSVRLSSVCNVHAPYSGD